MNLVEEIYAKKREELNVEFRIAFNDLYLGLDERKIKNFVNVIEKIDKVYNENYEETDIVNKLLGGELWIGGVSHDTNAPLYFQLDIAARMFKIAMIQRTIDESYAQNIIEKINSLRNKVSKLSFSSEFRAHEKLNEGVLDEIINSKGAYRFDNEEVFDKSYFCVLIRKPKKYLGSHYNSDLGFNIPEYEYDYSKKIILYESDQKEKQKYEQEKQKYEQEKSLYQLYNRLDNIVKKYFKNAKIPSVKEFDENLININENHDKSYILKFFLLKIVKYNEENFYDRKKFLIDLLNEAIFEKVERWGNYIELEVNEAEVKKQEQFEQEKQNFSKKVKEAYKSKSWFFKFRNKELDPSAKDFDNMTEEEFESYVMEVKSKGLV